MDRKFKISLILSILLHLLILPLFFQIDNTNKKKEERFEVTFIELPENKEIESKKSKKKAKFYSNITSEARKNSNRKRLPNYISKKAKIGKIHTSSFKNKILSSHILGKSKKQMIKSRSLESSDFKEAVSKREINKKKLTLSSKKEKPKTLDISKIFSEVERYVYLNDEGENNIGKEGEVSFDTEKFKYAWYARIIKRKVLENWFPPYAARYLGVKGVVVINFKIERDGSITNVELKVPSGNDSLDLAALNAIYGAAPFPPLPKDYSYDTLGVRFTFGYNVDNIFEFLNKRG